MGISLSLILAAAGAVLIWAVNATISGVILLIVGIVGFVSSLVFWTSWGGFNRAAGGTGTAAPGTVERTTVTR